MKQKSKLNHINAKSISEATGLKYRPIIDSFKYDSKGNISMTDRKLIIKEVEFTLKRLKTIYEI